MMHFNHSDPSEPSVLVSAISWIGDLLTGQLAAIIATIVVALIGFTMLSGRIDFRRGLSAIFGCFLIFGAKEIAEGLRLTTEDEVTLSADSSLPVPEAPKTPEIPNTINAFDPYAGTAVPAPR